jgi:hypothetical protein
MANTTRSSRELCVTGSRTLAEIKAGSYILPPFGGAYILVGGWLRAVGADCATATSVNINDDSGTAVVGVACPTGPLDNGVVYDFDTAAATRTTYGSAFKYGKGLKLCDVTANTLTGPDTIDFCVFYMKVSGVNE